MEGIDDNKRRLKLYLLLVASVNRISRKEETWKCNKTEPKITIQKHW